MDDIYEIVRLSDKYGYYYQVGNFGPRYYYVSNDIKSRDIARKRVKKEIKRLKEELDK